MQNNTEDGHHEVTQKGNIWGLIIAFSNLEARCMKLLDHMMALFLIL